MQGGRVLEDHALGKLVLEVRAAFGERVNRVELFALAAQHADMDMAMLEVRRQVHGLHRDQLGKIHLAHDQRAEFALNEFPHSGWTVFHGSESRSRQ